VFLADTVAQVIVLVKLIFKPDAEIGSTVSTASITEKKIVEMVR
jgi:hypothetical protein